MKKFHAINLLAILAIALFYVASPLEASAKKKDIGIQLYSVMGAMKDDPKGSIERLAKMGYNGFELVQWGGDPKVFGMEAADFKQLCKDNKGKIISTHSSLQEDPANEEENMNRWRQLFETQKQCGGKYFVIPSYRVEYTTKDVKQMADYFNKVGKLAKEYGLTLGYHNHAAEFQKLKDSDKLMWEYLVENTDPDNVVYELDVYWATKGGQNPVELLKKYPNRIKILHVKDDFVIGGSGKIDFPGIFQQFYKNKCKDYFVEIEIPKWLREKKNADGSKLTDQQIMEEMFKAADASAKYIQVAKFIK